MIEIQLPGGGRIRAALFGLLAAGVLFPTSERAFAETTSFEGQLDYSAFKRTAERRETVRIKSSPGGTGAAALALARNKVIVDGQCNSACAWSFVKNENACFTSRAVFGFHAAHDPGTGRRMNAATSYWLSTVRGSLRGRLTPLLETSSLITIPASQMRSYYGDRVCGAGPKLEIAAAQSSDRAKPKVAQARTVDRVAAKGKSGKSAKSADKQEAPAAAPQTFELLMAALAIIEAKSPAAEAADTYVAFVKTQPAETSFGDAEVVTYAAERSYAVAMLAHPEVSFGIEQSPVTTLVDVVTASDTETARVTAGLIAVAGPDATSQSDGRLIVGAASDAPMVGHDAASPIVVAARVAVGGEDHGTPTILADLANPALRPEDCAPAHTPEASASIVKLQDVSTGPCDVSVPEQRADLGPGTSG